MSILKKLFPLYTAFIFSLLLNSVYSYGTVFNEVSYKVSRVVDGDTVELDNGATVRYTGINAPETMRKISGEWVFIPEPFGVEAKDLNTKIIGKGYIRIEFDEDKIDKYGRLLAYVFTKDGKMVNAELIKNGLATVYTFYPNVRYLDLFLKAQEHAQVNKLGLWSEVETISCDKAVDDVGRMRTVKGVASKAYVLKGHLVLDFVERKKSVFKARIPLRNMPLFREKGIDAFRDYINREISVTGKISEGPAMYIDNPSEII